MGGGEGGGMGGGEGGGMGGGDESATKRQRTSPAPARRTQHTRTHTARRNLVGLDAHKKTAGGKGAATGAGSSTGEAARARALRSARTCCAFHPLSQARPRRSRTLNSERRHAVSEAQQPARDDQASVRGDARRRRARALAQRAHPHSGGEAQHVREGDTATLRKGCSTTPLCLNRQVQNLPNEAGSYFCQMKQVLIFDPFKDSFIFLHHPLDGEHTWEGVEESPSP